MCHFHTRYLLTKKIERTNMDTNEILELFLYFIIYSFLGWVLESVCKTIWEKKFVNSGFLHGPFCPIYGAGAIIMIVFLSHFKDNILLLFLVAFVVLTIWEYIVGVLLEKLFSTRYWDYSNNRFNFQGRICLLNSFYWGVLGVVFTLGIHPFVASKVELIPQNILLYSNILLYAYLLVDTIASVVKVKNIDVKLKTITELGENLKEKLEELKNIGESSTKGIHKEHIQEKIEELKIKQNRLIRKLYKHTLRLKKAFPTMKSEKITEFLNQKIDFSTIEKKAKEYKQKRKQAKKKEQ